MTIIKAAAINFKGMSFFTSMPIIIQFVSMNNLNLNQQNNYKIQSIEDADLRLQRTIELYQDASQQLKFIQNQCEQLVRFESLLKQQHQIIKKSFLFNKVNSFQNWQTKLKKISERILFDKTISEVQSKNESKLNSQKIVCSQKKHLQNIFSRKEIEEERKIIQKLESKLESLYQKIDGCLKEQCLNEKVMNRIKKQSKRAGKIKVLQFMDKQTNQYKGWLQDKKTKLHNQLLDQQLEQKIVENLQLMKQLVNKKIINNDYIYDIFDEKAQNILRIVEDMDKFGQIVKQKCQKHNKQAKQMYTNSYFNKKNDFKASKQKRSKQPSSNNAKAIRQYFQHAHQVIKYVEFSQEYEILSQQYEKLQIRIDDIIKTSCK